MVDPEIRRNIMSTEKQKSVILGFLAKNKGQMVSETEIIQALFRFFVEEGYISEHAGIAIGSPLKALVQLEEGTIAGQWQTAPTGHTHFG